MELRTLKVPIVKIEDQLWIDLRRLAYKCSRFGNNLLAESYAQMSGLEFKRKAYTDWNEELSSSVRDAISRECVGIWRRNGKKILRGEQRLAIFRANRALVVRDRGIKLSKDGDKYNLSLRVLPKDQGTSTTLEIWINHRDKRFLHCLDRLDSGVYQIAKATLVFERPGRKVFVLLSYSKPDSGLSAVGTKTAILLQDVKGLRLTLNGRRVSLDNWVHLLTSLKSNYSQIQERLRMHLGKRGYWHKLRRSLVKAGNFKEAAEYQLHNLSRYIANWCYQNGVSKLDWQVDPIWKDLPWHRLKLLLDYKCLEYGIEITQTRTDSERSKGLA